jgi:predicted dehydrogenase
MSEAHLNASSLTGTPMPYVEKERPNMSEHVRVGVVGTSGWADRMHLPSLTSHPRAEVAAICGRNRERAAETAVKYDIPMIYTDYCEMIARGKLDAIVISTPDDLHYPITMAALNAGLHVLCEKPMALNARQAREMTEKAEATGVVHMILFTWRWTPYFQYLRTLIDGGYIGCPYHCHIRFLAGYGRRRRYSWRYDRSRATGILGDLGSHAIDLARWLVGDIARVSAHLGSYVDRARPDGQPFDPANDSAVLLLEFGNGAQGMIQVSAVAHMADRGAEQQLVLHGEEGTLEVNVALGGPQAGEVIRGACHDGDRFETLPVPDELWSDVARGDFFSALIPGLFLKQSIGDRLFIDAILEDRPAIPSFYDGLKVQEVIDAAVSIGGK